MLRKLFRNIWVRIILAVHAIALLFFILMFFYVRNLTKVKYELALKNTPYDAIIVPGYPFTNGTWAEITKARVHWSKYLFDKGYVKNIIFSGGAVYTPYVESKIMRIYAEALGLPKENLFAETNAEHSTENLHYAIQLARNNGFKKIALATDPIQSFFLLQFAESQKYSLDFLPVQYGILEQQELTSPRIDPSSAFVDNFVSLPDRQGAFERFRGTLGKHIKKELTE